ncbi:DUF397 domain-containing protein [Streptomyces sp. RFCAC02]|uniref:DUF397 domain-containing protein n=1 Tax=Streptomyces sp. RFCAC02 TaxID=2499143 RepID=UPI001F0CDE73|nr:DUF397 domain-containing protein [Streptomyces sp. RFCAC02]
MNSPIKSQVADTWVKSSYSGGNGGDCVECAPEHLATYGVMPVRDSKAPDRARLAFEAAAWRAFIESVR